LFTHPQNSVADQIVIPFFSKASKHPSMDSCFYRTIKSQPIDKEIRRVNCWNTQNEAFNYDYSGNSSAIFQRDWQSSNCDFVMESENYNVYRPFRIMDDWVYEIWGKSFRSSFDDIWFEPR
jgi:hypothetical protein